VLEKGIVVQKGRKVGGLSFGKRGRDISFLTGKEEGNWEATARKERKEDPNHWKEKAAVGSVFAEKRKIDLAVRSRGRSRLSEPKASIKEGGTILIHRGGGGEGDTCVGLLRLMRGGK